MGCRCQSSNSNNAALNSGTSFSVKLTEQGDMLFETFIYYKDPAKSCSHVSIKEQEKL